MLFSQLAIFLNETIVTYHVSIVIGFFRNYPYTFFTDVWLDTNKTNPKHTKKTNINFLIHLSHLFEILM